MAYFVVCSGAPKQTAIGYIGNMTCMTYKISDIRNTTLFAEWFFTQGPKQLGHALVWMRCKATLHTVIFCPLHPLNLMLERIHPVFNFMDFSNRFSVYHQMMDNIWLLMERCRWSMCRMCGIIVMSSINLHLGMVQLVPSLFFMPIQALHSHFDSEAIYCD